MKRIALLAALSLLAAPALPAPRASFEDLMANLKSPNAKTRQDAVTELGKSRRREAVAPLAALVRDPEPKVRLEVVRALRELRDLSGVPALVEPRLLRRLQPDEESLGVLAADDLREVQARLHPRTWILRLPWPAA